MSDTAEERFLEEGVLRYANALETIDVFETMLKDRLRTFAKTYTASSFVATASPPHAGKSQGTFGHVLWASQEGRLNGQEGLAWLEFGIWWNEDAIASYAGLIDENDKGIHFVYTGNHPRIEYRKWSQKPRLFLMRAPSQSDGIDAELRIVVNELLSIFE